MKLKKPLPKGALPAGIVVVGLLVLGVGWMLVVSPVKKHIASLEQQTLATQQEIAQRIAAAHPVTSASSTPQIHVADIYRIAKAMPSITDMPDILLELDQTAAASGVSMSSISPGAPSPGVSGYSAIPISLSVTGDFYQLTDLLYRLRNLVSVRNGALDATGRLFSVNSVTLAPAGGGLESASLTLQTYLYGTVSAPGTSAATTATTATTSTTSTSTTSTTTTPSSTGPAAAGATP
jgi:type IV pilus assembly PilO-like protein